MASYPRGLRAVFYLTAGVVAAFVVSVVAGLWGDEPTGTGLRAPGAQVDTAQVRVEVLNGAGRAGLAREATERLRAVGFDVVFFGNAARFDHPRSFVLDRVGRPELARSVGAALGIDSVITAVDAALLLEATVVLGEDWPPRAPARESWWDRLRGEAARDTLP